MVVKLLTVELYIPYAVSLKDKRAVLRRLKDRLKKFNVSVAEVGHHDLWQRAGLGFVAIGTTATTVERELMMIVNEIERIEPGLITRTELETLT